MERMERTGGPIGRLLAGIAWRQPRYALPAILYPLLLLAGRPVIGLFAPSDGNGADAGAGATEYLNPELPPARLRKDRLLGKRDAMESSYGRIRDYTAVENVEREAREMEGYDPRDDGAWCFEGDGGDGWDPGAMDGDAGPPVGDGPAEAGGEPFTESADGVLPLREGLRERALAELEEALSRARGEGSIGSGSTAAPAGGGEGAADEDAMDFGSVREFLDWRGANAPGGTVAYVFADRTEFYGGDAREVSFLLGVPPVRERDNAYAGIEGLDVLRLDPEAAHGACAALAGSGRAVTCASLPRGLLARLGGGKGTAPSPATGKDPTADGIPGSPGAASPSSPPFNTLEGNDRKPSLVKAIVDENARATEGSRVRLRLLDDIKVGGRVVPRGTCLYATVSGLGGRRVKASVSCVVVGGDILNARLDVHDVDGLPGLCVPGSALRETATEMAAGVAEMGADLGSGTSGGAAARWGMGVLRNAYSKATSAVSSAIRRKRVTIKYGTFVYLVEGREVVK